MGYIKEPKGVDLVVAPSVLTEGDRKLISKIIADYKRTGKMPNKTERASLRGRATATPKRRVARKKIVA